MTTVNGEKLVIIVSGGSRGLGAAIVQRLLEAGHVVGTFSRSRTKRINQFETHATWKDRFVYRSLDATDSDPVREFVQRMRSQFGAIHGLINNAAVARDGVLAVMPETDIDLMLDVNLRGCLLLTRECVRGMLVERGGTIINISSIVGLRGFSGLAAYSVTKAGLFGMTRSLARELGSRNIRVNAIAPGYLETEMSGGLSDQQRRQIERRTPLGRLGTPEDVLPVVEFLLSDASQFITGQILTVDGGATA